MSAVRHYQQDQRQASEEEKQPAPAEAQRRRYPMRVKLRFQGLSGGEFDLSASTQARAPFVLECKAFPTADQLGQDGLQVWQGTHWLSIHLIALRLCEALGLGYPALYEKAYEWRGKKPGQSWLRHYNWGPIEEETIIPEVSEQTLRNLLYDLGEINNRSVVAVLGEEFTRLGYNVENWREE